MHIKSLKNFRKLQASSLLESVIATAIISVCVLIGFMIYINVMKHTDSNSFYNAKHKIDSILQESIEKNDYENETYNLDTYTIVKEVQINKAEHTALFQFQIKTANKAYSVTHLRPYHNE